ncbi:uncharacterized protein LOC127255362 [Andrographis paniculata]|uniref:uncharacterized protein LOC127255362 n=1 Tax=Andrographis paniculata TaxID=175694 RepID=UPI0021E8AF62|nr:uncharacterized protein LOC127255362 [Andrographis paniculata]
MANRTFNLKTKVKTAFRSVRSRSKVKIGNKMRAFRHKFGLTSPTTNSDEHENLYLPCYTTNQAGGISKCRICDLEMKKPGQNILKPFCSHECHFECIVDYLKLTNDDCPICGKNWEPLMKEFANSEPILAGKK